MPKFGVGICCKVNRFYIKPQRLDDLSARYRCCKVNRFYIKPQPMLDFRLCINNLLILSLYKKANHNGSWYVRRTSFAKLLKKF